MRTSISHVLLNDRDPCCPSKHVIHGPTSVNVILYTRCLEQPGVFNHRLCKFGTLLQLPRLRDLSGEQNIPLSPHHSSFTLLSPTSLSSLSFSKLDPTLHCDILFSLDQLWPAVRCRICGNMQKHLFVALSAKLSKVLPNSFPTCLSGTAYFSYV